MRSTRYRTNDGASPPTGSPTRRRNIGRALGFAVSLDYFDKSPFTFNGAIEQVRVRYT